MESSTRQIDRGPMTQAADDMRVAHTIERDCFVLKILNQGAFQLGILIALKQNIKGLDHNIAKSFISRAQIARHVDLGIAAAAQTVVDIVTPIDPAL